MTIDKEKKKEYNKKYQEKLKEKLRNSITEEKKTMNTEERQTMIPSFYAPILQQVATTLILGSITVIPKLLISIMRKPAQPTQSYQEQPEKSEPFTLFQNTF